MMSAVLSGRSREDTILRHVPLWPMRVGLLVMLWKIGSQDPIVGKV
jgi:hypothetical protein